MNGTVRVHVSSVLLSYTNRKSEVTATGDTLDAVLRDLDRQFPGLRFRVVDEQDCLRPHMRTFIGEKETRDLGTPIAAGSTLHLLHALSGG